jgi:peptidyl-prolyl cis-trans isomerase B (cyclophilin B)
MTTVIVGGERSVPSSKTRQRKLARAKMERQMARRAARARRNRQLQAGLAVGVVVLLATLGTIWALGGFSSKPKTAAAGACEWNAADTTGSTSLKDVGTPPTSGTPHSGTETVSIKLGQGTVTGTINVAKAPCTAASLKFLAGKKFFDNTKCHRLTTSGLYVLQCGDPSGTGGGGPAYTYPDENLPTTTPSESPSGSSSASASASASATSTPTPSPSPSHSATASPSASASASESTYTYKRGTMAMANSGANTNGSQFFIVYKDSPLPPNYIVFGAVTSGLDVVEKIAAGGAVDSSGAATGDGKPKEDVVIQTLTVTGPGQSSASPTPSASPSASASSTGSPSPAAKS